MEFKETQSTLLQKEMTSDDGYITSDHRMVRVLVVCSSSSSSSSTIIVRPLSRITTMGGVHTAQGA